MKRFLIKYTTLILAVITLASCQDFLDVNDDPNNPTTVTPNLILPAGQNYSAKVLKNQNRINSLANLMMYNWSQADGYAWYPDEFKYLVTSSFYDDIFEDTYSTALKQYQILTKLEEPYNNYIAIGMIMKVYHFQLLVDLYGDVPYTEALQRSTEATPAYDDAQTIYEDLIVQLSAAIDTIKNAPNTAVVPGDDDAMFGGDMTEWIKFSNSLKLRILVRQSSMSGRSSYITEQFNAILAEGTGFITTDVGINPGYIEGEEDKQNPMWDAFGKDASGTETMNNKATCASDYVLEYMKQTNDTREGYIYEEPSTGFLGVPQGLLDYDTPVVDAYTFDKVSNLGPGILKSGNMDAVIYTLAECYLNLAEAEVRGLVTLTQTPKELYEAGIHASFDYLGADDAEAYYSQVKNLVGWDSSSNKLEAIITQKWLATNSITAEQSWFDYSRTGYPSNLPISLQASTSDRPVRLFYPASEISSNGDNVPAQPNAFTEKIFWGN
ncbi:MAG: SusD/RagB family nutrient-binding outer membrane lipoprotein [Mangrovibacterium sp.]